MVAGLLVVWAADEPKKTSGERRVSRLNILPAGLLLAMKPCMKMIMIIFSEEFEVYRDKNDLLCYGYQQQFWKLYKHEILIKALG